MFKRSLGKLSEMRDENDTTKLITQLETAKANLKLAESKLKETTELWEYDSIELDIKNLKWTIHQLQSIISKPNEMSQLKRIPLEDASNVVKEFNGEVKLAEKQYKQISSEIVKKIEAFSAEVLTAYEKLAEIEDAAIEAHQLVKYLPVEERRKINLFEIHRVNKSNLQVVTLSKQLKSILQQLSEVK